MIFSSPAKSNVSRRATPAAFTLVEVALAMGVASFALVALIGMLPVGLATQRQAISNTIESQIVQTISNDILLSSFNNLSTSSTTTYHFDNSGQTVSASQTGVPTMYTASVTLQSLSSTLLNPINLQTQTSAGSAAVDQGYNVIIKVMNVTSPQVTDTYSVIIAKTTL